MEVSTNIGVKTDGATMTYANGNNPRGILLLIIIKPSTGLMKSNVEPALTGGQKVTSTV